MQLFVMSATPTKHRIRDGTVAKIKCTDFIKVCTKFHAFTTKSTISCLWNAIQPFVWSATPTKRRIRDGTVAKIKCTNFIEVCTKFHAFTTKRTIPCLRNM